MKEKRCSQCGHIGPEYGWTPKHKPLCYACCAARDKQSMIDRGDSKRLPLYLGSPDEESGIRQVTNWPGTLRFTVFRVQKARHNMCGQALHVWFDGPDGFVWHGKHIGGNNEIVHARRTKTASRN